MALTNGTITPISSGAGPDQREHLGRDQLGHPPTTGPFQIHNRSILRRGRRSTN